MLCCVLSMLCFYSLTALELGGKRGVSEDKQQKEKDADADKTRVDNSSRSQCSTSCSARSTCSPLSHTMTRLSLRQSRIFWLVSHTSPRLRFVLRPLLHYSPDPVQARSARSCKLLAELGPFVEIDLELELDHEPVHRGPANKGDGQESTPTTPSPP